MVAAPATPRGAARHVQVVDGLRGIAILLVLMFHYWQLSFWVIPIPGSPGQYNLEFVQFAGFLGVELFFFISAFCLFYPHAKAMFGQGPAPTLKHFYYRRAIKIMPSYLLALFVFGVFFFSLFPVTYKFYYLFPLLAKVFGRFPWLTAAAMVAFALLFRAWARHKPLHDFGQ